MSNEAAVCSATKTKWFVRSNSVQQRKINYTFHPWNEGTPHKFEFFPFVESFRQYCDFTPTDSFWAIHHGGYACTLHAEAHNYVTFFSVLRFSHLTPQSSRFSICAHRRRNNWNVLYYVFSNECRIEDVYSNDVCSSFCRVPLTHAFSIDFQLIEIYCLHVVANSFFPFVLISWTSDSILRT